MGFRDILSLRLVCRTWFNLIVHGRWYKQYRNICFDECIIRKDIAPVAIFGQCIGKYETLRIGKVLLLNDNLEDFWKKFALTVDKLDLRKLDLVNIDAYVQIPLILNQFQLLKELKISCKRPQIFFEMNTLSNIQVLYIYDLTGDTKFFDDLISHFPKVKSIHIKSIWSITELDLNCILKKYCSKINETGLRTVYSSISHSSLALMESDRMTACVLPLQELVKIKNLSLETIECSLNVRDDFVDLTPFNEFLDGQRKLKYLTIHAYFKWVPMKIHSKVTNLVLGLTSRINSFEFLKPLQKLRRLEFCAQYDFNGSPCFFGHTLIPNSYLKTLVIQIPPQKNCIKCWEQMLKSFNCLQSLTLHQFGYNPNLLKLIYENQSQLNELKFFDLHYNGCFLEDFQPMPYLTSLDLWYATQISVKGISNLCRMCPNLRSFRIHGQHQGYIDVIIKIIAIDLTQLETLEMDFHIPGVTKQAFNYIECYLKKLKVGSEFFFSDSIYLCSNIFLFFM